MFNNSRVVLPATHDTASAFMAVPADTGDAVYISSGTWSLVGVENKEPITSEAALEANFTNEGGYDFVFRFLKNIEGLWQIQNISKETGFSYTGLELLARKNQTALGQRVFGVYNMLAQSYAKAIEELKNITGVKYKKINIIGGGSKADLLNQLTANAAKLPVFAGPTEGTALGNIISQMIAAGEFKDLAQARAAVRESFEIKEFMYE
jgi:rhamnulokinase